MLRWWRALLSFIPLRLTQLKTLHIQRHAVLVVKEVIAGLAAALLSIGANNRIYVGLVLMGVVTPLSSCIYMLFNREIVIAGWYHLNYFHLFLLLGPSLSVFFCIAGMFLLFPEGCKRSYALIVPAGYTLAKIFWLIKITSNEEFWAMVPWSFLLVGLLVSAALFFMLDWLAHNKFHGADSFNARMGTLYNGADHVSDADFKLMFKTAYRAKDDFKKKF